MKNAVLVLMMFCGSACYGQEWVAAVPVVVQPWCVVGPPVSAVINYTPVVVYEYAIVERGFWCFSKRYESVVVPKIQYVPSLVSIPVYYVPTSHIRYQH